MPFVMCRQYDAPPSPYVALLPTLLLLLQVLLPFIYSASATVAVAVVPLPLPLLFCLTILSTALGVSCANKPPLCFMGGS